MPSIAITISESILCSVCKSVLIVCVSASFNCTRGTKSAILDCFVLIVIHTSHFQQDMLGVTGPIKVRTSWVMACGVLEYRRISTVAVINAFGQPGPVLA